MIEKIIFNVLAFTLFILIFLKLIKKNDTTYVYLLLLQFLGIFINFIELILSKHFSLCMKLIMYILSILLPILIFWLEFKKKIEFSEIYYLIIAKTMIMLGKDEIATKYLCELIEKNPNTNKGHYLLGKIYEKNDKFELALEEYQKVYELDPKNEEVFLSIGKLYSEIGREDQTIEIMTELLRKKPDYYEASKILADALNKKQEYKEATQVYMMALKYRPLDYDLYYNLAMTYTMINDFAKAKEYYEKAAKLNTILFNAKYNVGRLNLLYGDIEEAEKNFMECIDSEELEAGAYYYLARISMVKGEKDKAKNYANIAIEENFEIYEKMAEDNIFMPIMDKVNKPNINLKNQKNKNKKKVLSKKEKIIDKHLDEMCKIVGKLNNNDIEMIENIKKMNKEEIAKDKEEIERQD